ncbi:MFS transporter [Bacillus sp. JCM 19041]|uniref:MFS transporter n=1 Tax=Bacillus sp. JCM 19041 TaxID=1460637 RepID=UPI000A84596C
MALLHKFFLKPVKSYNRTIRYFLLSSIAFNTAMGIFMVMYPFYIRELGYTDSLNGQIIAFQAAATAIALLPAGILGDRYGRKRMLIIGSIMLAISFAIRSVSSTEFLLLFGAGLTGFFFRFFTSVCDPFTGREFKRKAKGEIVCITCGYHDGSKRIRASF